jgi:hypothetical protein
VHLFTSNFIVLIRLLLVFIIDFGFDIKELVAGTLAATFTGMALEAKVSSRQILLSKGAHYVFVLVIFVLILFIIVVVFIIFVIV